MKNVFTKKTLPNNKLALKYYEKVTDIGTFPGDEKYYKAAALRNNVSRKLADIYFDGTGVKKNRERSLELALQGSSGYNGFFKYYSKKYFNCACIVLYISAGDYDSSSAFSISINPFAYQAGNIISITSDRRLKKIAAAFKKRSLVDPTLKISLHTYPTASMKAQAVASRTLDLIKSFLVFKSGIENEKIITEAIVGGGSFRMVDIEFINEGK